MFGNLVELSVLLLHDNQSILCLLGPTANIYQVQIVNKGPYMPAIIQLSELV